MKSHTVRRVMWEIVVPLTIFAIYYMAVNPTTVVYVRHYLRVTRWHARNYWLYLIGPKWIGEALQVRGRLPFIRRRVN